MAPSMLLFRGRMFRSFRVSASSSLPPSSTESIRVRFAPSPTGNLHVGGARTALFNYLFARSKGGKFVLRIEDTDLERSTKESEDALLRDLSWLGLDWDEGLFSCSHFYCLSVMELIYRPGVGGIMVPTGSLKETTFTSSMPRNSCNLVMLIAVSAQTRSFSTFFFQTDHFSCIWWAKAVTIVPGAGKDEGDAKLKQLPPVYSGKWANATDMEVQEELEKGTPYTYRFRVPTTGSLTIDDLIRGEVSWSFDTLGDFVIMRSNGQPVYNFCVTVDDAAMAISHVIRSKLSKRHGATSVGQFKEMGFLPQAMVNYLALLGWGDGTENEFFTLDQLVDKFKIERVNKSGAIFDSAKLRWMNGQHLRSLPLEELTKLIGERWKSTGMVVASEGSFIEEAVQLLKDGIDLITDADNALSSLLSYPLYSTLSSLEGKPVLEDKLPEVAANLLTAYDSGDFSSALEEGSAGWQKWVKSFGKSLKRKGKSLMPLRVLLTGKLHGPDMGAGLLLVYKAGRCSVVAPGSGFVTLDERFKMLREIEWESFSKDNPAMESAEAVPVSN
ncbi:Glutamate--tRNA ligase, chloroplastic/mitochondrial [Sesamum angolense]|uniref:Glutamate--tRNA ligase, chloroplastic/mitochondrial n=1 Tax=Sesamum angolense TaxID=2727404 RepID=A0AAE2BXN3_9LAMI|nr:Glutamate--tRNA ligase, chloroplastic/mitochondrial [Sesamum angolense]